MEDALEGGSLRGGLSSRDGEFMAHSERLKRHTASQRRLTILYCFPHSLYLLLTDERRYLAVFLDLFAVSLVVPLFSIIYKKLALDPVTYGFVGTSSSNMFC